MKTNTKTRIDQFTIAFGILIVLLLFVALFWIMYKSPVSMSKVRSISPGTSQAEVEVLLGKPKYIYDENRTWSYATAFTWSIVYVYFDEQGLFESYEYDN